jgi:hypothetical protein
MNSWLSYDMFAGGFTPPTPAVLRNYFNDTLTPCIQANLGCYQREMQSVTISENEKVACDWTFQRIKNCNLPGAKAVFFTGDKGCQNGNMRDPGWPWKNSMSCSLILETPACTSTYPTPSRLEAQQNFNVRMRWKAKVNKRNLAGAIVHVPFSFVDSPRH